MNRIFIFTVSALMATTSAYADEKHDHATDHHENQEAHDHETHELEDHSRDASVSGAALQVTPEIEAALQAGGEPVVVEVLGVVCDFCAKAMNKTFGRREEVAAVYVDLDSKTLNLVFKPSMTLADDVIQSLVKKAGYRAAAIRRGEAALKGASHAADDT